MFDYQPTLKGRLLVLRPAETRDWKGLFLAGSDPLIWAGHPNSDRYLEENFRTYFNEGLESGGALITTRSDTSQTIGWSRYSSQFVEPGEIEIGWTFLARAYWGGLYNSEMKLLMLRHAFHFVDRVVFRIAEANVRSRRAAEKIGARFVPNRHASSESNSAAPYVFYSVNRSEFVS